MTDHLARPAAADPVAELKAVHDRLAKLRPQIDVLLTREDDRLDLGKAAQAAIADTGRGDQAGCAAAVGDLAVASGLIAKYHDQARFPNARAVAVTCLDALRALRAIRWGGGPGAVLSVGKGFDTVTRHPDVDVGRTVTITRSGDTKGLLVVPLRVSGDAALAVVSGLPAGFLDGETEAQATLVFGRLVPGTARAGASAPVAGRANIDPPAGTSLGAVPGFDFRVFDEPPPPQKGTINFAEEIGQIARNPRQPVVRMVKVRRDGVSTALPAQGLVEVSGLPPGVVQAAPADFKAGSQYGEAPFTFAPSGTAARSSAAAPMTGRADLLANDEFDPGDQASRTFTVVDGQPTPTPGKNPFHLPGVDLGPLPFLLGFSMGVKAADRATWIQKIGRPPLCASGGSHNGGRTATWQGVRGGDKGAIGRGTQLDIGPTNLGDACGIVQPGSPQLLVATWRTVPDNVKESDYADLANGSHDSDAYVMGWNAWLLMKSMHYTGAQLVLRGDKEYNGGGYGVTTANAPLRAKWLARFNANFNKGYLDAGADARPRHVLGLAQHDQLGPLEAHVPVGPGGTVMVDAIDVSAHPASQLNVFAGKPFTDQVAAVRAWLRGDIDNRPRYSQDHADPKYSGLAVAKAHGILVSNFESSPRDDGNLACEISAAAWTGLFGFWTEHADMMGGVGLYNHTVLDQAHPVKGWSDGVATLIKLARGGAS